MTAVAGDSGDVAFVRRFALRTAVFLVIGNRAPARIMRAFVILICHTSNSSLVRF
jgi:hypothetical protein